MERARVRMRNVGGNPTEEDAFVGIVKSEVGYCEFQYLSYIGI